MTLIVLRNILSWWLFKNSFGCIPVSSIQWGLFPKQTDCSDLLSPFLITINTDSRRITNSWSKTNHQFQRLNNRQVQIQNLKILKYPNIYIVQTNLFSVTTSISKLLIPLVNTTCIFPPVFPPALFVVYRGYSKSSEVGAFLGVAVGLLDWFIALFNRTRSFEDRHTKSTLCPLKAWFLFLLPNLRSLQDAIPAVIESTFAAN